MSNGSPLTLKVVGAHYPYCGHATDIFVPRQEQRTTRIEFMCGLQDVTFPSVAEAVLWSGCNPYLVFKDGFGPEVVPVCRGSLTFEPAVYPDSAHLVSTTHSLQLPTVAAETTLLFGGQIYKLNSGGY